MIIVWQIEHIWKEKFMDQINILILVTEKCNLKCTYCYEGEKRYKFMSEDVAKDIVSYIEKEIILYSIKKAFVHFHGGEPFLNYEAIDLIIDEINRIEGIDVLYSVTTNGTLYNKNILECMKKIDDLNVSIDGMEKSHDLKRMFLNGEGSYEIVTQNIKQILNENVQLTARMTCTKDSLSTHYEDVVHVFDLGIKKVISAIDYWTHLWEQNELQLYVKHTDRIYEYIRKKEGYEFWDSLSGLYSRKGQCLGGIYNRVIDCEGNIYPCMSVYGLEQWAIGNIYHGINDDWEERLWETNSISEDKCINCGNYNYCAVRRCVFYRVNKDADILCENLCNLQKDYFKHRLAGE